MEDETAYTLALWRVKESREAEFVEAWKDLSDYFLNLPNPPGTGTLVRSVEDPGCSTRLVPGGALRTSRGCVPIRAPRR
jgi:hypothetical protein